MRRRISASLASLVGLLHGASCLHQWATVPGASTPPVSVDGRFYSSINSCGVPGTQGLLNTSQGVDGRHPSSKHHPRRRPSASGMVFLGGGRHRARDSSRRVSQGGADASDSQGGADASDSQGGTDASDSSDGQTSTICPYRQRRPDVSDGARHRTRHSRTMKRYGHKQSFTWSCDGQAPDTGQDIAAN